VDLAGAMRPFFNGQLHELQRRNHQVRGAVAPGYLRLQDDLLCGVALHAFAGQCWARDVAAQLLERFAVPGITSHRRVQAETLRVGAQEDLPAKTRAQIKALGTAPSPQLQAQQQPKTMESCACRSGTS
jgi:hypothetical protein